MDGADDVGTRQHEHIAVPAQVLGVILEALAAEVRLRQLVALDHRAHRTVEDEHALLEGTTECRSVRLQAVRRMMRRDSGWSYQTYLWSLVITATGQDAIILAVQEPLTAEGAELAETLGFTLRAPRALR